MMIRSPDFFLWSTFLFIARILHRLRPAHHSRGRRLYSHAAHCAIPQPRASAGRRHRRLYRSQFADRRSPPSPRPLEQQINGAEGMKYITSSSTNNGVSTVTATFDLSRDPDLAAVDIENRVNTASGRLPNAVKQIGVTVAKTSQNFVFGGAVFSPDKRYSTLFISNYLDVYVRDSLKRVPGVADVLIFGERKYSMRLWLDPVRMASRSLTADDVVNAPAEQNVEVAAGQVGSQPAHARPEFPDQRPRRRPSLGSRSVRNIILKSNADGTLVRLKDVGHAELGAEDYSTDLDYNGRDAVGIAVTQLSTANALDVHRSASPNSIASPNAFRPA
jgi:HAE1 family hydrophobic/amphiphilic exporter-1